MRLSNITSIGWCANMLLDRKEQSPFTLDEIYRAVDESRLVDLLLNTIDDSAIIEIWASDSVNRAEVEQALGDATEALRGRELRKTGAGDNPLCVIMAIALETIQQRYSK